jgi:hypothetical protein
VSNGDNQFVEISDEALGDYFKTWVMFNAGIPIIAAQWQLRFALVNNKKIKDDGLRGAELKTTAPKDTKALEPLQPIDGAPGVTRVFLKPGMNSFIPKASDLDW